MCSVYELHSSLVGSDTSYTYDMYTALEHHDTYKAVGITDGLAAVDFNAKKKDAREKHFPMALLSEHGLHVKCREGEASVKEDKVRILVAIGGAADQLDATVHGRVAAAGLRRALEKGGEEAARFLLAVQTGFLRKLEVDFDGCVVDEEAIGGVWQALCADQDGTAGTLQALALTGSQTMKRIPEGPTPLLDRVPPSPS